LSTINIEIEEIFYISSILSETANLPLPKQPAQQFSAHFPFLSPSYAKTGELTPSCPQLEFISLIYILVVNLD